MSSRRIKLCQFTPCLWSGGTEERIARVLAALDRREFEMTWIGFGPVRESLVEKAGPDVRVQAIPRNALGGIEMSLIPRIANMLRRARPDVVHVHNWSTSLYGIAAARLAGVPSVLYGLGGQDNTKPPSARRQAAMRALAPHVDTFTAVCDYLGNQLSTHWSAPKEKVEILKTGIDLDLIDAAPSKSDVRAKLQIPKDATVVGAISVFRPVKRIPDLIDAVGKVARSHPNIYLLLVGNPLGVSPEDLRAQAKANGLEGRFNLLGRIEQPAWTLPAFDVFVNCSVFEGSSNAIIEAMGARLPVVATAVGGTPELVEDGVSGLLFPPEDVDALAAAIDRLVGHPSFAGELGERGRAKVEREHTHASMIRDYKRLYEKSATQAPNASRWTKRGQTLVALQKTARQVPVALRAPR